MTRTLIVEGIQLFQLLQVHNNNNNTRVVYRDQNREIYVKRIMSICVGRRNSELPGRLRSKNVLAAGKAARSPMLRKPLSPVTSNILNSPEDHKDAYTAKPSSLDERILTPKTKEENERVAPISVPTTPAASVAMTETATPFTPALEKRMDEENVIVEYSFEEVRAGFR